MHRVIVSFTMIGTDAVSVEVDSAGFGAAASAPQGSRNATPLENHAQTRSAPFDRRERCGRAACSVTVGPRSDR